MKYDPYRVAKAVFFPSIIEYTLLRAGALDAFKILPTRGSKHKGKGWCHCTMGIDNYPFGLDRIINLLTQI